QKSYRGVIASGRLAHQRATSRAARRGNPGTHSAERTLLGHHAPERPHRFGVGADARKCSVPGPNAVPAPPSPSTHPTTAVLRGSILGSAEPLPPVARRGAVMTAPAQPPPPGDPGQ